MPPRDFTVDRDDEGARLEGFLRRRLGWARTLALKALRKGWVRIDGRRARADARLAAGQVVRVTNYALPLPEADAPPAAPARPAPPAAVEDARASLRRVDEDVVVSAKPAGVVVHAGSGHAWGWIDALAAALGDAAPPVPVGRLDRDTSGLLACGRTRAGARRLFEALRAGALARTYTAAVHGRLPGEGVIDLALEKRGAPGAERVEPSDAGRAARTRWRAVEARAEATLLALELDTGRTHQIRAHLAALGHPLLGDPRYGTAASAALTRRLGLDRLFLHAGALRLPLEGGEVVTLLESLPPALERAWSLLG
ncbi:MAG: RluA family pseudouridine synthase [Planctomycetes bacterium]|nr:RluA family pseudouridine synthase [Planctomycetota bacterium]